MTTKLLRAIRRRLNASKNNDDKVKVYVTSNGSLYVKGRELAQNAAWREKVKQLIDADLTGRNKPGHRDGA